MFQLALDPAQLHLGGPALLRALALDGQDLIQRGDELLVGVLERLHIHNAPLGLTGGLHGAQLEHLGVFLQKLVGHLGHRALGGGGLTAVLQSQGQHHLALPQGDGIHQGGLDLLHHQRVVVLQQPGLGPHLDGDHPGQLQIVELLFKPLAHLREIVVGLGVLLGAAGLGLVPQGGQFPGPDVLQPPLARQDVHGQFLVILQVQLVHLVQHGHVLQQSQLVLLQLLDDLVHIALHLGILGLHGLQLTAGLFEQAEQALFLLLLAKALQLHHQLGQGFAHLPQVLGADGLQGVFRKTRHILLCGGAVLEHQLGVHHIDLGGKLLHHSFFRLAEHAVIQLCGRDLRLFRRSGRRPGGRVQGQHRRLGRVPGIQRQLGL